MPSRMRLTAAAFLASVMTLAQQPAGAQVSDDVVKIGVLNDQSGPYSDIGGTGTIAAVQLAIDDFGGKVLGKPIEVVGADHQNKPDVASSLARTWLDSEKVDALADGAASSAGLAMQEIAKDRGKIFIITGPASSDFTGKACSPTGFHFAYDTYALGYGTGRTLVKQGGDSWFFLTADYAFGQALERDTTKFVEEGGGKVLGAVRHPLNTSDFSSYLLRAQASNAKVIGLANAGTDTINSIKQAAEFGITERGQRLAGLLVFLSDVNALGLKTAQGLVVTESFYWDQTEETRAWTKRFMAKHPKPPTMVHAATYSGVTHYLKAIQAAGTDEGKAVAEKMRAAPVQDFYTKGAKIREDGRVLRDFFLLQVKKPDESKYPFDFYKILTTIPGNEAARPLADSACPLVKKG